MQETIDKPNKLPFSFNAFCSIHLYINIYVYIFTPLKMMVYVSKMILYINYSKQR